MSVKSKLVTGGGVMRAQNGFDTQVVCSRIVNLNIAIACSMNGLRILFQDEIMEWIFTIF